MVLENLDISFGQLCSTRSIPELGSRRMLTAPQMRMGDILLKLYLEGSQGRQPGTDHSEDVQDTEIAIKIELLVKLQEVDKRVQETAVI